MLLVLWLVLFSRNLFFFNFITHFRNQSESFYVTQTFPYCVSTYSVKVAEHDNMVLYGFHSVLHGFCSSIHTKSFFAWIFIWCHIVHGFLNKNFVVRFVRKNAFEFDTCIAKKCDIHTTTIYTVKHCLNIKADKNFRKKFMRRLLSTAT